MNILISCSGRQVYLIDAFRRALKGDGSIIATDMNKYAASFATADKFFVSPGIDNPIYEKWLLNLCLTEKVGLLLSCLTAEQSLISKLSKELAQINCKTISMPLQQIKYCTDKLETHRLCDQLSLNYPDTWGIDDFENIPHLMYPLIVKPRLGEGGRGQFVLKNREEGLVLFKNNSEKYNFTNYILQKLIPGQEYGIDIINNLSGNYCATLCRQKIESKNGETDVARILDCPALNMIGETLGKFLRHKGLIDVDLMFDGEKYFILDVNPRFGGGYIFSHMAGANVPAALIAWAHGIDIVDNYLKCSLDRVYARFSSAGRLSNIS